MFKNKKNNINLFLIFIIVHKLLNRFQIEID